MTFDGYRVGYDASNGAFRYSVNGPILNVDIKYNFEATAIYELHGAAAAAAHSTGYEIHRWSPSGPCRTRLALRSPNCSNRSQLPTASKTRIPATS